MSAAAMLEKLDRLGVSLRVDGDSLNVSAPRRIWTPGLRAQVAAEKPEIIAELRSREKNAAAERKRLIWQARDCQASLVARYPIYRYMKSMDGKSAGLLTELDVIENRLRALGYHDCIYAPDGRCETDIPTLDCTACITERAGGEPE